jgi:hypothetical protein
MANPTRDPQLLAIFESADDALQGLLGYHLFIKQLSQTLRISHELLNDKRGINVRITHEWERNFEVGQFLSHAVDSTEFQHCRTMLVAIVPQFEVALRRIKHRLWSLDKLGSKGSSYQEPDYKPLLSWAFQIVRNTRAGSCSMQQRLPRVCGDIDDARRLRNLSMHENNYFARTYEDDAIRVVGVSPQFVRGYVVGEKVFLVHRHIEDYLYSHIEFLHIFHNTVQRKFFKCKEDYNYEKAGKQAELYRMISGRQDVRI